jgi:hypothetical protein
MNYEIIFVRFLNEIIIVLKMHFNESGITCDSL